jgi:LysR family hydrogen peroxide-inducible transcriptional activator
MNISWMTMRDLEYLVAVGRHLHFGRAAESSHVSQPALSAQIRKIEEQLGFRVYERTNRRVALTDHGRMVVKQAQIVLEEAQKIGALAQEHAASAEPRGELRIGVIATLGPYYVPHFLPSLRKTFPGLQPILREGLTRMSCWRS